MNVKRIASLLRELADELERPEPTKKPRRKTVVAPTVDVSPEAEARARRALRKQGVAA